MFISKKVAWYKLLKWKLIFCFSLLWQWCWSERSPVLFCMCSRTFHYRFVIHNSDTAHFKLLVRSTLLGRSALLSQFCRYRQRGTNTVTVLRWLNISVREEGLEVCFSIFKKKKKGFLVLLLLLVWCFGFFFFFKRAVLQIKKNKNVLSYLASVLFGIFSCQVTGWKALLSDFTASSSYKQHTFLPFLSSNTVLYKINFFNVSFYFAITERI